MKKIVTSITALMLTLICVQAQADADVNKADKAKPVNGFDVSKAFPDEEITNKMEMKGMKVYNYMVAHKFADLQQKLHGFLDEEWMLEDAEVQAQAMAAAQKQVQAQGMKILGMVTYKNTKKTGSMVMLMQMASPALAGDEGESQTMVTLTHIDM